MFKVENGYDSILDHCVNSAMLSCRNLTTEQLEELLRNDERVTTIIQSLPQVRNLPSEREMGLSENKALAEWNLAQKPRLDQLKDKMRQSHTNAKSLKTDVEVLKGKLDTDGGSKSLEVVNNLLMVAAQEADDDAEALAKELYEQNVPIDIFLKDFQQRKKIAHLRKIKSERLNNLLREQHYSSNYGTAPYPEIPKHRLF
ncbi:unnamed protein product [Auanema sp. JU1783]|nr:unnamed protein product [Auanema sp. JU1783]